MLSAFRSSLPRLSASAGIPSVKAVARTVPGPEKYVYWIGFQTRWGDNDVYGHLNNVQSIAYVDSAVNEFLINHALLTPHNPTQPIGLVVSSSFSYPASLAYPEPILAGISISKLGTSSVTYEVGLFSAIDTTGFQGRGRFTTDTLTPPTEGATLLGEIERKGEVLSQVNLKLKTGKAATHGQFVHVFATSDGSQKSTPIPDKARKILERLVLSV